MVGWCHQTWVKYIPIIVVIWKDRFCPWKFGGNCKETMAKFQSSTYQAPQAPNNNLAPWTNEHLPKPSTFEHHPKLNTLQNPNTTTIEKLASCQHLRKLKHLKHLGKTSKLPNVDFWIHWPPKNF